MKTLKTYLIQSRVAILCMSFLMISNTIDAQWIQVGQDIFNENLSFGSVSLNADATVLAIGVPQDRFSHLNGYAQIYNKVNDVWTQIGQDLVGENLGDAFGKTISLNSDGSIVAIGAPGNDGNYVGSGHVRIFQNINDVWTQMGSDIDGGKGTGILNGIQLGDLSAQSISLSADGFVVAIGAGDGGLDSAKAKIYQYINNSWTLKGSAILGKAEDIFGVSVSLNANGSLVAVGARFNTDNGEQSGEVRIFEYNNTDWVQVGQDISGKPGELSGDNVSLTDDGTVVAVGMGYSQYTRVYRNINNVWTQIGEDILQDSKKGRIEVGLNSDGSYLVAGMPRALKNQGVTKFYRNINNSWVQINENIYGGRTGDYFGTTVDITADGSIIAIGGIGKTPNGIDNNLVKVYENTSILSTYEFSELTTSIYPNPATDAININFEDAGRYSFAIYDITGKELFKQKELNQKNRFNLSKYASGMYFLKIKEMDTNKVKNIKIIKQ